VLLSAFPVLVALHVLGRDLGGIARKAGFGALALAMTLVITGAYHLGYEQYREDGIAAPELGNTVMSVPAIVTLNPAGSIIAHASMHVAAVEHSYETDVYLPPQTDAEE
jgi:hypothetical protein